MESTVRVKFVLFDSEVLALFPDFPEWEKDMITSYAHIGQHGNAHKTLMRRKSLSEPQYRNLKRELEMIGYKLQVI